jgi:hypothetical protein
MGANEKKLIASIGDSLAKKLAAVFAGGAAKEEAVAEAPKAEKAAAVAEEKPAAKKKKAAEPAEESEAAKPSEDETTVAASADEEETGPASPFTKLDLAVGAHVYGRKFSYNQSRLGDQRGYNLPVVSAPSVSLDYFFVPFLGITVGAEYSLALISEDSNGDRYRTSSMGYSVGVKGRHLLGSTELTGGLAYAAYSFKVTPESDDPAPPQVAGVDYKQIRVGAGVRLPLSDKVALVGGGNYLHLLGMGELQSEKYFKYATGRGGEGYAGIAFALPWLAGLEARITADIRRYVFAMNSEMGDTRVAGGATDQYMGANIAVGYRN